MICRAHTLVTSVSLAIGAAAAPAGAQQLYWTELSGRAVKRSCVDGTHIHVLDETGSGFPYGVAVDRDGGKLYWTTHQIHRANLDGSDAEILVTGTRYARGIALDTEQGFMYWADEYGRRIRRAKLDGSNVEDVVASGLRQPYGIALDLPNAKIYWVDAAAGTLQRANLDGSDVENLIKELFVPQAIALDLRDGKVYWSEAPHFSLSGVISRANLDGSAIEVLYRLSGSPRGIAIDDVRRLLYWSDYSRNTIHRANLDASGMEDVVTGLNAPHGIAVDTAPCGGGDCQPNGLPDQCDICDGQSDDCNLNDVPDECEPDCDLDGVPDACEPDCNGNRISDVCDILEGRSTDALPPGGDGIPDDCQSDCNANFVPDENELADGLATDCNQNQILDSCDIDAGTSVDCNGNVLPDECEPDCNENGQADECDIINGISNDCDSDIVPDECEPDCNHNEVADDCDIASGASLDLNGNGRPDECEPPNDSCHDAIAVGPGETPYTGVGATVDGPSMDYQCGLFCDPSPCYEPDIWYELTSPAGGRIEITASPVDGFPGSLIAYVGCDCPVSTFDTAGCGLWGSPLVFYAVPRQCYKIQFGAAGGTGGLVVDVEIPPVIECPEQRRILYVDASAAAGGDGSTWTTAFQRLDHALTVAADLDNDVTDIRIAGGTYTPNGAAAGRDASFALPHCVTIEGGYAGLAYPNPSTRDPDMYETVLSGDVSGHGDEKSYHVVTARDVDERTVLDGVTITAGEATGPAPDDRGGGVYCERATPTILNTRIVHNRAQRGGAGVYNCDGSILDSEIADNSVVFGSGGGLEECDGVISDSRIARNSSRWGGGLYNCDGTILRCAIFENTAAVYGAGLAGADGLISHCRIYGNSAGNTGGGLYGCNATVRDSVVSGNVSVIDGGAFSYCDGEVMNCTITGNDATALGLGGAMANCDGTVTNSIFSDNAVPWLYYSSSPSYSCTPPGSALPTNIGADPEFRAPGYREEGGPWIEGDYRLLPTSTCINSGDPSIVLGPDAVDLDGHARVLCGRIDMGAYEFGPGDFDCDRTIHLVDFTHWPMCMTGPTGPAYDAGCEAFDFDFDRDLDLRDFAGFQGAVTGP